MSGMVAIEGNTYPVRDELKALGGRWNWDSQVWMVPAAAAGAARELIPVGGEKRRPAALPAVKYSTPAKAGATPVKSREQADAEQAALAFVRAIAALVASR